MSQTAPICIYCKHYNREKRECSYFGKDIPTLILHGFFNHKTPIKNEKTLFELKENLVEKDIWGTFWDKKEAKKYLKQNEGIMI